jgi:putrescine transport system ATP-binding protein
MQPAHAPRAPGVSAGEPWKDPTAVPFIRLEGVSKSYGQVVAVDRVDLAIHKGELFSLLGASGCGKTTLLRILAGFETPTAGRLVIDGVDMAGMPPYRRPTNMMFQSYALFPHMTVEQNVAFGLKQEGVPRARIAERVGAVLDLVQMGSLARRKPHQLSGGQRQRTALARSLIKEPKVLLLDEPLGALDKKLREQTQFELVNIQERVGITFVVVTHDQEEAMTMSSRIGVMDAGRIEQVGTPAEIYEYPQSRYVADFIGTANLFAGTVLDHVGEAVAVRCPDLPATATVVQAGAVAVGTPVTVMVRPEKMTMARDRPADAANAARGVVRDIAYLGDISIYHVQLDGGKTVAVSQTNLRHTAEQRITWEDTVWIGWHPANAVLLNR